MLHASPVSNVMRRILIFNRACVKLAAIQKPFRMTADLADRLLVARLEINPQVVPCVLDNFPLSQC